MYVTVPLFVAGGSVNELGVRQNLNYLSHWCCESKQVIHSNCTRAYFKHIAKVWLYVYLR